ncbi:hypothetical protein C8A01DRAFT_38835 [Parachaetomium inaequale]|uniref:Uncharacterized protein n=1 Tax=Parachaetomium inaequale TaxID=2588326 RepID=A0AAN6PC33_9PEZI|nr:hypothetical protein C8A01DRAFT_38835 [Parachaetomium inaequale]
MKIPNGGTFWAALSQAVRPQVHEAAERWESQRKKTAFKKKDFVDPLKHIPPSSASSNSSKGSGDDYGDSPGELDEDEHDERQRKPEDITVHLVRCFLHHALAFCLDQRVDAGQDMEVRATLERCRAEVTINDAKITAEDDGGICRMRRAGPGRGWKTENAFLALIEAKRAFQGIHCDEKTGNVEPIVSDRTLAQYLGEAVITWMANRKVVGQDIFLIAATNTYVRFVHFRFGADYHTYITADERAQKRLIKNPNRDTCVHMQCSDWFDLNQGQGREDALCLLLALLRWHDVQLARRGLGGQVERQGNGEEDSEDEDENDNGDDNENDSGDEKNNNSDDEEVDSDDQEDDSDDEEDESDDEEDDSEYENEDDSGDSD